MKFAEIEREFTKKVMEQLNAGKRIHAQAMGGSQGEIASVVSAEDHNGKTALFANEPMPEFSALPETLRANYLAGLWPRRSA